ncbi:glutamate-ammonia-ligase adenylyltransferase [Desulfatibacillum alkenivorans DSM 16219]|uniref:Glutamate-ammonia-ligase adenylyltransferase n=1 Tax=Desulfatibacillum alkenivorans DSM 16219 TaxID=1121393 RepID=A0A1M6UMT8_9BACT|nr:bifunctional [glutamate--ammonia ligase]-adenylyl-L-tyrosine phosphorylase/[glutamate--ammonia-ligase] adenylyltransferase [Desulfatibacillum alkenivorans]SHK70410.1 glutamate-ammonia-ligase adenylyltransferase [Desulfatibacillum alkenivorans DSM 16219]
MKNQSYSDWAEQVKAVELPAALMGRMEERVDAFAEALEAKGLEPPANEQVQSALPLVFTCSDFVYQYAQRFTAEFCDLARSDLRSVSAEAQMRSALDQFCQGVEDKDGLIAALRRFRNREMVRIAWRDLAGWDDLFQTLQSLSALARVCIDKAQAVLSDWMTPKWGVPTGPDGKIVGLVVMGMGKLGAQELNFSSDIDLIFSYKHTGTTQGGEKSVTNLEYFTKLCKDLIKVLGAKTDLGQVFRVDMRLRPDGANGPMVMPFSAMEQYYEFQGREWERYAWIKARPVAGDMEAGMDLLRILKPFLYRKYLDYTVFEALREMKRMISLEVKRKGLEHDIKIGPGGIREIEFVGQVMQLLRGGVLPCLQEPGIMKILDLLVENKLLPQDVCEDLKEGYILLRRTENRIQEFADRQEHKIPRTQTEQMCLSLSMGYFAWEDFEHVLARHRNKVQFHFEELLADPEEKQPRVGEDQALLWVWHQTLPVEQAVEMLALAGFDDPEQAEKMVSDLKKTPQGRSLSEHARLQLDRLIPSVLAEAGKADQPEVALKRVLTLVEAVIRRTAYLSLLVENPEVLERLVKLCDSSPLIASLVTRYPALLDELMDPGILYTPLRRWELDRELHLRLQGLDPEDEEEFLEQLRMFKQVNVLRVIAADVTGALPLMRVSDHLTEIAECILTKSLDMAWNHVVKKHGEPTCQLNSGHCQRGFSVVAYGKLGGIELSYGSDLDMVFLHAGITGEMTKSSNPLYNGAFFARLGQRVIHILGAHTPSGVCYETDMRLRPSGGGGLLVSHVDAFQDYQRNQARTWEHQALVRARPVAGDVAMASRFFKIRREVLCTFRNDTTLKAEVVKMRNLMKKELEKKEKGLFDIKQGPGGIVDIEFLVQYLVLSRAHDTPSLTDWTDNMRLLEAVTAAQLMPETMATSLKEAYLALRGHVHALAREDKPALVPLEEVEEVRQKVMTAWRHFFGK